MSKKKTNKNVKRFSLSKDDLANIHGRLKVMDYTRSLIAKDCYDYVRNVTLKRLGIPQDWAILHDPDWKTITVVSPEDKKEHEKAIGLEDYETGQT